jgi:hypothetical protein
MKVKTMADISDKFKRRTAVAGPDYEKGVKNPRVPWAAATSAAEPNYDAGVQQAISDKRFGKGVVKAGDAKHTKGCVEKGTARYGPGVAVAVPDYEKGFAPYRAALEAATLPPRRARRDPSNLQRVSAVVDTMIKTAQAQS